MAEVDGYLAAMAAEYPGLRGKTFASVYYYEPGNFAVNTDPDGQTAQVLGQLSMVLDPCIAAEVVDRSLSLEQTGLLESSNVPCCPGSRTCPPDPRRYVSDTPIRPTHLGPGRRPPGSPGSFPQMPPVAHPG